MEWNGPSELIIQSNIQFRSNDGPIRASSCDDPRWNLIQRGANADYRHWLYGERRFGQISARRQECKGERFRNIGFVISISHNIRGPSHSMDKNINRYQRDVRNVRTIRLEIHVLVSQYRIIYEEKNERFPPCVIPSHIPGMDMNRRNNLHPPETISTMEKICWTSALISGTVMRNLLNYTPILERFGMMN